MIRDEVLALTKPRIAKYQINPECEVFIRSISELERSKFESLVISGKGEFDREGHMRMRSTLLAYCICDESGKRIFSEADVPRVMDLDAAVTGPLFDFCIKHCGIDRESLDELKKNFAGTNGDSSHISSPETEVAA